MTPPVRHILLRSAAFLAGALLLAELLLRTVVPACELPPMALNREYGFLHYDTSYARTGLFTQGQRARHRSRWELNDAGFMYPDPFLAPESRDCPLIALFGSSHIEGLWVAPEDDPGKQLERALDHRWMVYNFAFSNSMTAEHFVTARYARDLFAPDVFIFVIQPGYLLGSTLPDPERTRLAVEDGNVREVPPEVTEHDSPLRSLLRSSALARYLVWNLHLRFNLLPHQPPPQENALTVSETVYNDSTLAVARAVAEYLCEQLRAEHPDSRLVFAHGEPVTGAEPPPAHPEARILEQVAPRYGIETVDITRGFHRTWLKERRSFRFEYDQHWNAYGLGVLAEVLADSLEPDLR